MVHDSFRQLATLPAEVLRQKTQVQFEGEVGSDSGGLIKEWYLGLGAQLADPNYGLFVETSFRFDINESSSLAFGEDHLKYFHFVGRLFAKAVFDRQMVDFPLVRSLYKRIIGVKPTLKDLGETDPVFCRSLRWILNNDITGVIVETFSVQRDVFGAVHEIELCPGGKAKDVTEANKEEYVQKMVARHDSAEDFCRDFCRLNVQRCTAMDWVLIPAYCSSNS